MSSNYIKDNNQDSENDCNEDNSETVPFKKICEKEYETENSKLTYNTGSSINIDKTMDIEHSKESSSFQVDNNQENFKTIMLEIDDTSNSSEGKCDDNLIKRINELDDESCSRTLTPGKSELSCIKTVIGKVENLLKHEDDISKSEKNEDYYDNEDYLKNIDVTANNLEDFSSDENEDSCTSLHIQKRVDCGETFKDAEDNIAIDENVKRVLIDEKKESDSSYESCIAEEISESQPDSSSTSVDLGLTTSASEELAKDHTNSDNSNITQNTCEDSIVTQSTSDNLSITDSTSDFSAVTPSTSEFLATTDSVTEDSLVTQNTSGDIGLTQSTSTDSPVTKEVSSTIFEDDQMKGETLIENEHSELRSVDDLKLGSVDDKNSELMVCDSDTHDTDNTEDDKIELKWEEDDDEDDDVDEEEMCINKSILNSFVPMTEHGLNKPDVMLEIPTQEFIEFSDDDGDNDDGDSDNGQSSPNIYLLHHDTYDKDSTKSVNVGICVKREETDGGVNLQDIQYSSSTKYFVDDISEQSVQDEDINTSNTHIGDKIVTCTKQKSLDSGPNDEVKMDSSIHCESAESTHNSGNEFEKFDLQEQSINKNTNAELSKSNKDIETNIPDESIIELCSQKSESISKDLCDNTKLNQESSKTMSKSTASKQIADEIAQPSTSNLYHEQNTVSDIMNPDSNLVEMSDSLGLLAESSRVMEDDEDQEEDEDGDDEDDFDVDDDNSNQMTAEHSEDSNAQPSETDTVYKDVKDETQSASDKEISGDGMNFTISDVVTDITSVSDKESSDDTGPTNIGRMCDLPSASDKETSANELNDRNHVSTSAASGSNNEPCEGFSVTGVDTAEGEDALEPGENISEETDDNTDRLETNSVEVVNTSNNQEDEELVNREVEEIDQDVHELAILNVERSENLENNEGETENSNEVQGPDDPEPLQPCDNPEVVQGSDLSNQEVSDEVETVKLSDTSDTEVEKSEQSTQLSLLETLLVNGKQGEEQGTSGVQSFDKAASTVLDFVDLESESSDDDVQEVEKQECGAGTSIELMESSTTVTMPAGIEVISSSAGNTSEIVMKESEIVISGLPKPPPLKPARLNTSEVTIKTAVAKETPPCMDQLKETKNLEIFNLDSDEEEPIDGTDGDGGDDAEAADAPDDRAEEKPAKEEKQYKALKCVNGACASDATARYALADQRVVAFYDGDKRRRAYVCESCAAGYVLRSRELIQGIRDFTPLLDMDIGKYHEELVEISDSESDGEGQLDDGEVELIGTKAAKFLEDNLTDMFNEAWRKYEMDSRLTDSESFIQDELKRLRNETSEIDDMFKECQVATDKLRNEIYATFEPQITEVAALNIYDVNECLIITPEIGVNAPETRQSKRRPPSTLEPPAKRPAIPLGYTPLNPVGQNATKVTSPEKVDDDNTDISVVTLSAEVAPADLPPPGELTRAPLRVGMSVYAMKNVCGSWLRAKIIEILPKSSNTPFTSVRVRFENKSGKNPYKILPGRHLAYAGPADVRMTIGTRVIALFKDTVNPKVREAYYSGVVAEAPNPVNKYRYLVFFDDGYAQYAPHAQTRLVSESSALVWEEVHSNSRDFVRQYLLAYPERPMVRLHKGQNLKTEWSGKWWASRVESVDASLVQVVFAGCDRREWIYRGSTRLAPLFLELQAAERQRPRALPRAQPTSRGNMPYVEYTRSDETKSAEPPAPNAEEMRRQRAVAKKSTASAPPPPPPLSGNLDHLTSRVVFYTPKNSVKPLKMVAHSCGPKCKRKDVLELKDLRTYNPLAKPLLSGWERQVVRWRGHKDVMYVAPCGRRLRTVRELHRYLRATASDLPVDLFDFSPNTHCLAEFVLNKCIVAKKDLSHGKENVPVPCVNYYDSTLPEFCSYNTERTPTAGVPLNLDTEFLCGCDCDDDCEDKSKCACWQMTLEGARTIGLKENVGYVYKRLPQPLPSGIYECNSRCKCKHTCLNRVAQHPLQLKLQVFKTMNRGWGIRALNDVPEGAFLCVYAGNLLTDATANLDGLNEGDEYLAELDYIEVVEQMKEGFEEDIPKDIKKLDRKELHDADESQDERESSSEEEDEKAEADDDFQPGYIAGVMDFDKRLRKRVKTEKKEKNDGDEKTKEEKEGQSKEDCITISDDEEVREPSCFTAAAGMGANEFVSKYRSVRTLFGEDEACYIMDAKVQGNIGRYLNHSCCPNVFVQNVFVDTHDPRFPWVAFFALTHIKAGTELTWNYNYDVGSVPGKTLYCYCGAANCRGRLL